MIAADHLALIVTIESSLNDLALSNFSNYFEYFFNYSDSELKSPTLVLMHNK